MKMRYSFEPLQREKTERDSKGESGTFLRQFFLAFGSWHISPSILNAYNKKHKVLCAFSKSMEKPFC